MTENLRPVRKLVNGSMALLDSLVFANGALPNARVYDEERGVWETYTLEGACALRGFHIIELDDAPLAVNVRIGGATSPPGTAPGSAPGSVLWHGVELDNLSDLIESVAVNAQVIPLFASKNMKEGAELRGAVAAQSNLPSKAKVVEHQYVLAFALTDFK